MENTVTEVSFTHIAQLKPGFVPIESKDGITLVAGFRVETDAVGFNLYGYNQESKTNQLHGWFNTLGEALIAFSQLGSSTNRRGVKSAKASSDPA